MSRTRYIAWLVAAATVAVIIAAWQRVSDDVAYFVSRPSEVGAALLGWFTSPELLNNIPPTVGEALGGFVLGVVMGILFAVVLTASPLVAEVVQPFVTVFVAIPKLALAPLFVVLFGIGYESKLYFVATAVFFIPFYSLFVGLQTVDRSIINNAKILGASRLRLVLDVYVPSVTGAVAASMRVAVSFALLAAVMSEFIVSTLGIGHQLIVDQLSGRPDYLLATIFVIGLLGFFLDRLLLLFERRFSYGREA